MSAGARVRETPFGTLAVVELPAEDDAARVAALVAALAPEERAHCDALAPPRQVTFAGGRIALRAALAELDLPPAPGVPRVPILPILPTPRGGPALPPGLIGSIAHKPTLAVALAALAPTGVAIGVDVEVDRASRFDISARVLTPAERRRLDGLAPASRARAVLAAFAAKEAVYKALDPWLGRHIAFQEVEVEGTVATLAPRAGEPAFTIEIREEPLPGHLLVTARVHRRAG